MNHRLPTALLLAAAMIAGCNPVNRPIEGRSDYPGLPPQVTFATRDIASRTAVSTPIVERDDAGNLLHVTVPIRNDTSRPLYVDYRVTFLDRNGATLSTSGWMPKHLEANTPDAIHVN